MKIGLLGFGVVGRGVYELVRPRADMEIAKVLCRRAVSLPDAEVIHRFDEILLDPSIDTVVEVMGGLHPAWEYVKAALEHGKNVVTANKAMVSCYYEELAALLKAHGGSFRCTGAVGGGIGWLSALERARRCQHIRQVGGILNGTCNYILDSMSRLGLRYEEALAQAQALGYAEADPSMDVDGIDSWHKLILSANVAFGVSLCREQIPVQGIRSIRAGDVAAFTAHGLCCRLIGSARMEGGQFSAYVQPTLFPLCSPEAAVPSNYNLITLVGTTSGRQSFFGQGAGRYPTAYNVVQDLSDVLDGKGFYSPCDRSVTVCNQEAFRFYVRGDADPWLAQRACDRWGDAILTEPVSVAQMHTWCQAHPSAFMAALPERKDFHCSK